MRKLDRGTQVADENGYATQALQIFSEQTNALETLSGVGSPEGIVSARSKREYMDETGTTGNIKYIKKLDNIGGDTTKGWILI